MKIVKYPRPRMTLTEFADRHGLTMEIRERSTNEDAPNRFYAHFQSVERLEGYLLIGCYGDGRTEREAMEAYIPEISERVIVVNAMTQSRREIVVPRITGV